VVGEGGSAGFPSGFEGYTVFGLKDQGFGGVALTGDLLKLMGLKTGTLSSPGVIGANRQRSSVLRDIRKDLLRGCHPIQL